MANTSKKQATKKAVKTKPAKTVKTVKKVVSPAGTVKKPQKSQDTVAAQAHGLTASVVGTDGKALGRMTMPKEVFGETVNKQLIAQAVRVYLANQRQGGASTKTRGEVEGSTRKIYRQKGTGRARHGSIRAHIFVGGGVVFGPVPHDFSLSMPVKMRRRALASALSNQFQDGNVTVVDGLAALKPKTKLVAQALSAVGAGSSVLLVVSQDGSIVARCARNIEGVDVTVFNNLNTYEVMAHKKVVFMKDAVAGVKEIITKEI